MQELHQATDDLYLRARLDARDATTIPDLESYSKFKERQAQDDFNGLKKSGGVIEKEEGQLDAFFIKIRQFADRYGLYHLDGVDFLGRQSSNWDYMNQAKIAESIAFDFESPDQLLDALERVRDANLYRAYAEKRDITGKM